MEPTIRPPKLPRPLSVGNLGKLTDYGEYSAVGLSGGDLTAQIARDILFEQVQLRRVNFTQTNLISLRLSDVRADVCDFSGAIWEKPRLRRVELVGCRLSGAHWVEAQLEDVRFKDCILEGVILEKAVCKVVRFEKCNLRGAFLEESELNGVVFSECDMVHVSLRGSKLLDADLRGSLLNDVQVNPQDLKGAIIEPAQAIQVVGLLGIVVQNQVNDP